MQSETVRRLTSLLLAPLLQRGPGVLAESLTSHWDASSCKRLSSTYVSLGLDPFTTQSYLDILQPLAKYEARMGDLIGNNDGSTNSPCRLQTSSRNSSSTVACFKQDQSKTMNHVSSVFLRLNFGASYGF